MNYYKLFIITIISFLCLGLKSQTQEVFPLGTSPSGADVAYKEWSPWANPASTSHTDKTIIKIGFENRYFAKELCNEYIGFIVPTPYFNISGSYNFFGFADYNEMMAALTLGKKFGKVAIGIEFDYFNMFLASENIYRHAFTAQVGIQAEITKRFTLGARIFNPIFSKITFEDTPRKLPVCMHLGANYEPINNLNLLFQLGYTLGNTIDWAFGVEYEIMKFISVRTGIRGINYVIPQIGVGLNFSGFHFDLNVESDFRIGTILLSSLSYRF